MQIRTILFDLDNTLYPSTNGLWLAIRERMDLFMLERLGLPNEIIPPLRHEYFQKYGTTLRGLQIHYQVDPYDFLSYAHDIPIGKFVKPDPELRSLLLSLNQNKFIFTNSDLNHVLRVLNSLGIADCIQGIVDITAMNFICKPELQAFKIALELARETAPKCCLYLDDSVRNLEPAFNLGIYTILVGDNQRQAKVKLSIRHPNDLRHAMPDLWRMI